MPQPDRGPGLLNRGPGPVIATGGMAIGGSSPGAWRVFQTGQETVRIFDPFQCAGHSVLTLFLALVGGKLTAWVFASRRTDESVQA